jgi:hypothetical protein
MYNMAFTATIFMKVTDTQQKTVSISCAKLYPYVTKCIKYVKKTASNL